jgi:predicted O-methyltransferase YrrM
VKRAIGFAGRFLFAAIASAYLFSFGWVSRRNRGLIASICRHFGFGDAGPARTLPTVSAASLSSQHVPIVLMEPEAADGNVSLQELLVLARSVAARRPGTLLELGTFDGRTTLNLAANVADGARVVTVDLPADAPSALNAAAGDEVYVQKPVSGARYRGTPFESRIEQRLGDTATLDFGDLAGKCDWVLVDAAHSYDYVMNDSRVARAAMQPSGIIFWHDYGTWDGVTLALNELQRTDPWFSGLKQIEGTSLAVLVVGN